MVSLHTVLQLQSGDTSVHAYSSRDAKEKYGFVIALNKKSGSPRPLLVSSSPCYHSAEQARRQGRKIRNKYKSLDVSAECERLNDLGGDLAPIFQKLVKVS